MLGFRILGARAPQLRVVWTATVEGRVVARRELTLDGNPNGATEMAIKIRLPEIQSGAILSAVVSLSIEGKAMIEKRLWIFPPDPFADHRKTLSALPIALFDPVGQTAERLKKLDIQFAGVHNLDLLAEPRDGVLVIGEGISFDDYRQLPERLALSAARGNRVLCLAGTGGAFELPFLAKSAGSTCTALRLRKADVIAEFDKRLDFRAWPVDGRVQASGINFVGEHGRIVGSLTAGDAGWPWMEADLEHNGRIILCGFAIIDKWESSPAPRYLLRHVLDRIAKEPQTP
jgi:hypothetical protein